MAFMVAFCGTESVLLTHKTVSPITMPAIPADGFRGAAKAGLLRLFYFFRSHRLPVDNREADFVIAPEKIRGGCPALIAINTGSVHIIRAGNIVRQTVIFIGHNFVLVELRDDSIRAPELIEIH